MPTIEDRFAAIPDSDGTNRRADNPFQPGFAVARGAHELVGREQLVEGLTNVLSASRAPEDATMLFGARGSGKT